MKKYSSSLLLAFLITFSVLSLLSCSKQGPIGPMGATGNAGPAGPKGDPGTANVVLASRWFNPVVFTKDTVLGIVRFYYDDSTTLITQNIIDNGTVITYGTLNWYDRSIWPTNQVAQMPITLTYQLGGTDYEDTWSALATPGNLRIQFQNDKNYYGYVGNGTWFRYIIIPPGLGAPGSVPRDYAKLCQMFHIPEN